MKLFIALGGLLVLALLVLLVGPSFVNWTSYRASFEAEASRVLGQKVEVRGEASARLLPFPSLTFSDVVVGDDPADPVLTMRGFRMDAELAPYLSGEIRIFHMRLDGPRLSLPIGAGGRVRWPVGAGATTPSETVVLERIEIADGTANLVDTRSSRALALSGIDAVVSAQSLRGPYSGSGTLLANGEPLRVTFSTGAAKGDGALPFRIGAESDRADLALALDASASSAAGVPMIDGTLSLVSPLAPAGADEAPRAAFLPPLKLQTKLSVTPTSIAASELRAEVGDPQTPYVASGSAVVDMGAIPHFDLQLEGQAIDVDQVAPPAATTGSAAPSLEARIEGIRTALSRIPTLDIPGRLRLALPLVTIGDTTIRNVSLAGSPSSEGWSIEALSAELPGRTLIDASGFARTKGEPGFRGSVLLASRQPAAFFGWAGGPVDPTLASLQRAGFSANVDLTRHDQRFDALEVDLNGEALNGSIARSIRPEGRSTTVDLRGGSVDLDPVAALAELLMRGEGRDAASERLDVQFSAGPVTYAGFAAAALEADFMLDRGVLDFGSFDARDFAGADVHLEGTVADAFGDPQPDLSVDVSAEAPERFADFLRRQLPGSPLVASIQRAAGTLGPLALRGTAASQTTGTRPVLALDLAGTAAGTEVAIKLAIENGLAAARLNGRFGLDLSLNNDNPAALLGQFGVAVVPVDVPGPLSASLSASGDPGHPVAVSAALRAPGTALQADGTLLIDDTGPRSADMRLRARSEDLSPWLTAVGIAAGQPLDGLPVEGEGAWTWAGGDWTLDGATATLAGSSVSADLSASSGGAVTGAVRLSDLSLNWLGTVLAGTQIETAADGGEPSAFRAPLLPERPFTIAVTAERASGLGVSVRALHAELDGEASALRAGSMGWRAGDAAYSGKGEIRNAAGFLSTRFDLDIRNQPIDAPGAAMRLTGVLGGSLSVRAGGQTWPALLSSLDGHGTVTLAGGRIAGISPDLLPSVLQAADADGFETTQASVAALVERASQGAVFPLGTISADVAIGAGSLRIPEQTATSGDASLSGGAAIDLRTGTVEGSLRLRLTPPPDEAVDAPDPAIDYRLSGPRGAPVLDANVEPLASYLSVRAYQREQARIEALQEDLRETVRLRREARLYRERAAIRETIRADRLAAEAAAREEAERLERERLERIRVEAERQAAAEAAERRAAAEAAQETERARRAASETARGSSSPAPPGAVQQQALPPLSRPETLGDIAPPRPNLGSSADQGFSGLPGVIDPNRF